MNSPVSERRAAFVQRAHSLRTYLGWLTRDPVNAIESFYQSFGPILETIKDSGLLFDKQVIRFASRTRPLDHERRHNLPRRTGTQPTAGQFVNLRVNEWINMM